MNKAQAGHLGGQATFKKHGSDHMKVIGLKGAQAFWKKYTLLPKSTANFAIVNRQTNQIVAYLYFDVPRKG